MYIRNDKKIIDLFKTYHYYSGFYNKEEMKDLEVYSHRFYHNKEETKILVLSNLYDESYVIHIMNYEENYDSPEEYVFNNIEEALEFIKSL